MHSLYRPDLSSSDNYLLLSIANDFAGEKLASRRTCVNRLSKFFVKRDESFYGVYIMKLTSKWKHVVKQNSLTLDIYVKYILAKTYTGTTLKNENSRSANLHTYTLFKQHWNFGEIINHLSSLYDKTLDYRLINWYLRLFLWTIFVQRSINSPQPLLCFTPMRRLFG